MSRAVASPGHFVSARAAAWSAWSLTAIFVLVAGSTLWLVATGGATVDQGFVALALGFAVAGSLVASREPGNAVGWLLAGIAIALALTGLGDAYLAREGRPGEVAVAWFASWIWFVWFSAAGLILPLVFPDGALPSRRWRRALWLALTAMTFSVLKAGLGAGVLEVESVEPIRNPIGITGPPGEVVTVLGHLGEVLSGLGLVLSVMALTVRLRRSHGRERQQLKLFAYVGGLGIVGFGVATLSVILGRISGKSAPPDWANVVGAVGWFTALVCIVLGMPLAVGIAILKHRLYGIDVVIKRTLVYGSLTALLVATYLGLVLVLRFVLSPTTGESDLAVAGSTLGVAALFRPLRTRVQAMVDRRFYRSRYDAARTLETFSGRLRDELDLETLGTDLRLVVTDTMQPAHVALWLRSTP